MLNNRGITLLEVLATIVLLSIISILAWKFFFQTSELNNREVTQSVLQQEANHIINSIQNLYTTNDNIVIENPGASSLIIEVSKGSINSPTEIETKKFQNPKILYEASPITNLKNGHPNFSFTLTLKSKENEKIVYSTETTFFKLK